MTEFKKVYLSEIKNEDLDATRNEYFLPLPSFLQEKVLTMINNPLDIIMVHLMFNIILSVVPLTTLTMLYYTYEASWKIHLLVAGLFILQSALFFPRYALLLHYSSHRALFKNEYLNLILPYLFSPFLGFYCGIGYHIHHLMMHHHENNSKLDITQTEIFQRDSFIDYLKYYVKFKFGMLFYLPYYAFVRKYYFYGINHVVSNSVLFYIFYLSWNFNKLATFWVFIYPALLMSILLSFGNWSQHCLVDPERHESNYNLTYNCMNHPLNQVLFNDGYHVNHHINGGLHWSKLPSYFMENLETFAKNDGILFRGLHFSDVGFLVMTNQWKKLASHYVYVDGGKDYSEEELIEMFKSRVKPINKK